MRNKIFTNLFYGFFALMLFLNLICLKLIDLRTPVVQNIEPTATFINGKVYECVLPIETVISKNEKNFIYIIEETNSWFHPTIAKKIEINIEEKTLTHVAISGINLYDAKILLYSDRPINDVVSPVKLY